VKPFYVTSLGAFTSVGVNVPETMGSLLSRLQWFDDLTVIGASGEPVSGARVRLAAVDDATERYVAMSRFALAECRRGEPSAASSREALPLLLATSRARDLPCAPGELLERILAEDAETAAEAGEGAAAEAPRVALDRGASRVFAEGRLGALSALAAARQLVTSGRSRACYVGAVDSLLDPVRLNELLEDGRLLDGAGTDGFIPGEAAVFLKIDSRPAPGGGVVLGAATTDESPPGVSEGDAPVSGSALARAAREALRLASVSTASLAALVHDGSSEHASVEEIAMAAARLPFGAASPLRPWAPAYSVGETGAAAAFLSIAMTTFFLKEEVFTGPTLVWLTSEVGARAALVMAPPG
jgi:3-oxoacyl-[acyl-carrier-protein] synthase-1